MSILGASRDTRKAPAEPVADAVRSYFDGVKISSAHRRMLFLAALCYMFNDMDTGTFSYAAPVLVKTWGLTLDQIAQISSLSYLGMFAGAIVGGFLADKLGRKRTLMLSVAVFSVATLCAAMTTSFPLLAVTRFFNGFGVISMDVIAMVYISEMLPAENRGRFLALAVASGTVGIPIGAAFARWIVPMGPEAWRWLFYAGSLSILLVPLCYFIYEESPRWLVSKGRVKDAEAVIYRMSGRLVDLSGASVPAARTSYLAALKFMFSGIYLKRTIVLLLAADGIVAGGTLLVGFYPTLLQEYAGFDLTVALSIMAISWWGVPIGDVTASFFSDTGGRKTPLALFALVMAGAFVVSGLFVTPVVIVLAVFLSRIFGHGSASMYYAYLSESYPTHVRSNAVGLISAQSRIVSSLAVYLVPPVLASSGWLGIHVMNAAIVVIPVIVVLALGPRTSRRTLEEINTVAG